MTRIIIVVLVVALAVLGILYLQQIQGQKTPEEKGADSTAKMQTEAAKNNEAEKPGLATYKNNKYKFQLQYSDNLVLRETANSDSFAFNEKGKEEAGTSALITAAVDILPAGTTLEKWIGSFDIPASGISKVAFGKRQYLKWSEDVGLGNVISFSTLLDSKTVLTISSFSDTFPTTAAFKEMLSSVASF